VKNSGGCFGMNLINTVSPRGNMRFQCVDRKMNSKKIIEQQKEIILEFIPLCLPELNPDEQVWNRLKLSLVKNSIFIKEKMESEVLSIMRSIQEECYSDSEFLK